MKQAFVCAVQTVIFMIVTVWLYKAYPQSSRRISAHSLLSTLTPTTSFFFSPPDSLRVNDMLIPFLFQQHSITLVPLVLHMQFCIRCVTVYVNQHSVFLFIL